MADTPERTYDLACIYMHRAIDSLPDLIDNEAWALALEWMSKAREESERDGSFISRQ